jgi:HAD superfamily hydrolase (TIGR01509 family)
LAPVASQAVPAVVFDFDGLVIDSESEVASCVVEVLAARGVAAAVDDVAHLFGSTDADDEWARFLRPLGVSLADLRSAVDAVLPARVDRLPMLPGVDGVLDAAHAAGWRVGMATGQRRPRLDEHLARLGLLGRFDAIVTRAEVAQGKPAPDIYLAAAARLGVAPADCLALEDSLPGCHAALAAGMKVIVCPSPVTAGCAFPAEARRVASLVEVDLTG